MRGNRNHGLRPRREWRLRRQPDGPRPVQAITAAFVQHLGEMDRDGASATTSDLTVASLTVTTGNTIAVVAVYFAASAGTPSATDNLGNSYSFVEVTSNNQVNTAFLYAPITVGGTLTLITVTHSSSAFTSVEAAEFSGVGTLASVGGGTTATSQTPVRWCTNTIPIGGIAIGGVGSSTNNAQTAGPAYGSPSVTPVLVDWHNGGGNVSSSLLYGLGDPTSEVSPYYGSATTSGPGNYSGAGGIFNPASAVETDANAESPSGTGAAYTVANIKIAPEVNAASATGAANNAQASIKPSGGLASATGAASDATTKVSPTSQASSATGAAQTPQVSIRVTPGIATATGAANDAQASIKPSAGLASATGAANTVAAIQVAPVVNAASATGTAPTPQIAIYVNGGHASATGAAYDATVSTSGGTNANAQAASATGAANTPQVSVAPNVNAASATASAFDATVKVSVSAGHASAGGSAYGPTLSIAPHAGHAAVVAAANGVVATIAVHPELASATGEAYGVTTGGTPVFGGQPVPAGSATSPVPAGAAAHNTPGGSANSPLPSGSASHPVPR